VERRFFSVALIRVSGLIWLVLQRLARPFETPDEVIHDLLPTEGGNQRPAIARVDVTSNGPRINVFSRPTADADRHWLTSH